VTAPPAPIPGDGRRTARRRGGRLEPALTARAAGLRYVTDAAPGIRRRPSGPSFRYLDAEGAPVRDAATRRRIAALAIPPAWTAVWICADPNGHLQATGRDARGRKQYRYHPAWRALRGRSRFERMIELGERLPRLRQRVAADLRQRGPTRARVLAAVVRLLERSLIRVGNGEYARHNRTFGLTTLRRRHVELDGDRIRFEFRAKSGRLSTATVEDPRVARVVLRCLELDGQELFAYADETGARRDVTSGDVNRYLREATGEEFTAKDLRTWAGTVRVAAELRRTGPAASATAARRQVAAAVRAAAERLGNRPATCRNFYVHPGVIDAYLDGDLSQLAAQPVPRGPAGLAADERFLLALLRSRGRAGQERRAA
jgi:DNA topoisomerase-1